MECMKVINRPPSIVCEISKIFDDVSVQSEDIMDTAKESGTSQAEIVGFSDDISGSDVSVPLAMNDYQIDSSSNASLGKFLSRPVLIQTYTWVEGQDFNEVFFPWADYFSTSQIKKKLDNYYLLRCSLRIKVVINASPFYYSAALVSYRPLGGAFNPAPVSSGTGTGLIPLIGRSQRPNFTIYPQNSQGGEMSLPFLYPKNWLDATSLTDLQDMGTMNIDSYNILLNANSVAGQDVNVQVYAWATDLELAGPTYDISLQAADEYAEKDGVISGPASAISRAAANLATIPSIAPFATATALISGAVGEAAKLFGYSNVPVIADVHAFKSQPFPQMASAHIGTPVEKLTLDPKNELSIDSRVTGVDTGDELIISRLVQRESFVQTFNWDATAPANSLQWGVIVNPAMAYTASTTGQTYVQYAPMGMVNRMFRYWRGDMVFRFKFLCTKYHRGRVMIQWDPHATAAIGTSNFSTATTYSKIVDITDELDVEFNVPYTQTTSYLKTRDTSFLGSVNGATSDGNFDNGVLSLRVVTQQTSPVSSAPIVVLMYVRGAENLEFAAPRDIQDDIQAFTVQSEDIMYDDASSYEIGVKPSVASKNINVIHMGEQIKSLRELMRRSTYIQTMSSEAATGEQYAKTTFQINRSPSYPGFDPNGWVGVKSNLSGVTILGNLTKWSASTWIGQCFIGQRGSMNWTFNFQRGSGRGLHHLSVVRDLFFDLTSNTYQTSSSLPAGTDSQLCWAGYSFNTNALAGLSLTDQRQQASLAVQVPMYSRFKFIPTSASSRNLGLAAWDTKVDGLQASAEYMTAATPDIQDRVYCDMYTAIGTDFDLIFFLNVPTLFSYTMNGVN